MPRPVHFEIHADQPERAVAFYENVFGWSIQKWEGPEPYWLVTTGPDSEPGINGALFQRETDSQTTLTMSVDSIEDAAASVVAAGGKILQAKTPIPSMGWFATCEDTEGNKFGLFTNDPNAA